MTRTQGLQQPKKKLLFVICSTFGEIKTLRLPQKLSGAGTHRGFAFVDFLTKQDAKVRSLYCASIKEVLQLSSTKKCRYNNNNSNNNNTVKPR